MSERENILARIQEALRVPSRGGAHGTAGSGVPALPMSGAHGVHGLPEQLGGSAAPTLPARQWLPAVGSSAEAQLEAFAKNAVDLKASFQVAENLEAATALLRRISDEEGWKRAATHQGLLTDAVAGDLGLPLLVTDGGYEAAELEKCDAGITECDALVAQTGSVLLTSHSAGGRALSALPPHHVVLATRDQLVSDLPEAFAVLRRRYAGNYPSFISFVTGPSRTGDIERILVLGAHGPKKLTIVMVASK